MLLNSYVIVIGILIVCSKGDEKVHTWWHNNSEYNENSPVKDENVRCSTHYNVQIRRTDNESSVYQSFVYMSIPRGGRLKWEYEDSDGAEFANSSSLTMSWTTFEYLTDIWIEIQLRNLTKKIDSIDQVTFRPNYLNFEKKLIDNRTISILVPYQSIGSRLDPFFSSSKKNFFNQIDFQLNLKMIYSQHIISMVIQQKIHQVEPFIENQEILC